MWVKNWSNITQIQPSTTFSKLQGLFFKRSTRRAHVPPCLPMHLAGVILDNTSLMGNLPTRFHEADPNTHSREIIWRTMCLLSHLRNVEKSRIISLHTDAEHGKFLHSLAKYHIERYRSHSNNECFPENYWLIPEVSEPPVSVAMRYIGSKIDIGAINHIEDIKPEKFIEHYYGQILNGGFSMPLPRY